MFFSDYHLHSSFSSDAESKMEEIIIASINLGLKEIAITDHIDFDYPTKYNGQYPFLLDVESYIIEFDKLKNKYDGRINCILGIEIGLQEHVKSQIEELVAKYPFEFIIGSTHVVDRLDLYEGDFFVGKTKKESYVRYFEYVYDSINSFDCFNVYGHIDYINRYGGFTDKSLDFKEYRIYYEQIFKALIQRGCGIEVNTSGYRYGLNHIHPQLPALSFYKELGGEIVTLGSDAHKTADICCNFVYAIDCIRQAGFHYISLSNGRFVKI